jgi:uncharacterized membrane protein YedE/YeeE
VETFEQRPWTPYLVGAGIGLLNTLAAATVKKTIGVTTPFENAAAVAGRATMPTVMRTNKYFKAREDVPKLDWEAMLVLGILIGSRVGARLHPDRAPIVPQVWKQRFGPSAGKRMLGAAAGGALMMFGARTAKGCTSGHGISGTSQLAASSWLFVPIFMLSGIATARALFGKRAKR